MKQPNMLELKFKGNVTGEKDKDSSSACCCSSSTAISESAAGPQSCCPDSITRTPRWVTGVAMTVIGPVNKISNELSSTDSWEHFKCRTSAFRNSYTVAPGLYAVGNPNRNSDVLVSANYKFSFDTLRRELKGLDVWILVLDTKGINVWCAAGKGTFGTAELVRRIGLARLQEVVDHRRLIVPQLGAPGVSAHAVTKATGFRVHFGSVRAKDIPAYIKSGYKATREMRKVNFSFSDRLVLTPMEINPAMKKYPLYALITLVVFGLAPSGILFKDAFTGGLPFLILGLISVFSGALLTPVLLPFVPFRSFALKGWLAGLASVFLATEFTPLSGLHIMLLVSAYIFFPLASSYIALQFTGSTTFTGMSGVKKELKIALPLYLIFGAVSLILLLVFKLTQWRVL